MSRWLALILCFTPAMAWAQEYSDPLPWEQQSHPPTDPGKVSLKPGANEAVARVPYWVSLTSGLLLAGGGLVLTVPNLTLQPPGPKPGFNQPMLLGGVAMLTAAAPLSLFMSGGGFGLSFVAAVLEPATIAAAWGVSRVSYNVFRMSASSSVVDSTIGQTFRYPTLFLAVPLCLAAAFAPVVASFVTGADVENEGNSQYLRDTDMSPEIGLFSTPHGGMGLALTFIR